VRPGLRYIVASSPRTGSYLLCEGLETTGIAGRPTEVFSPEFHYVWKGRWRLPDDCSFATYFRAALRHGTTSNGVYGVKIHWMHVPRLAAWTGVAGDVLEHLFPGARFVHITRRDQRAQALSYFRALATNEWWRIEGVPNTQKNGHVPVFDAAAVLALERQLQVQDQAWTTYFRARNSVPLTVEYEALAANYRGEVARVLDHLGLDATAAAAIPAPRLVCQSNEATATWRGWMDRRDAVGVKER
jgi:trehalose 2-sulfotransferase